MIKHDVWPITRARWYRAKTDGERRIRLVVMHTMEAPEKGETAESVARYFASLPDTLKASAHVCVDNNSVVQCVDDNDIAYGAPGANSDGLHVEMAGNFRQTAEQWADDYSQRMLEIAAGVVAQFCLQYEIPVTHLTDDQLLAGERGIVGHSQVSAVYRKEKKPDEHRDPGDAFPWETFIARVATLLDTRKTQISTD